MTTWIGWLLGYGEKRPVGLPSPEALRRQIEAGRRVYERQQRERRRNYGVSDDPLPHTEDRVPSPENRDTSSED